MPIDLPLGRRGERPVVIKVPHRGLYAVAKRFPGVEQKGDTLACAWDVATFVAAAVGAGPLEAPVEPVPALSGLDEYRRLELPTKLRPYQREMVAFLARRSMAINADPMRCLAGSTVLTVNRGGKAFKITMARLARGLAGELGWDLSIPTRTQSMDESGSIRLNLITAIHHPGRKRVLLLTLADGKHLEATADHKIATPAGMKPLGQLRAGETVLVAQWPTKQEKPRAKNSSRYLQGFWSHPFAEKFEQSRKDRPVERVARCKKHRLAAEAKLNGLPFEEYVARVRADELDGLQFLDPAEFHVHHRDGDHTNDAPENLEVLSQAEHSRLHGLDGHWRAVNGRAVPVAIKSITDCGEAETFDLTMFNPWNNYVANEIIVSNSGKTPTSISACVAVGARKVLIVCPAIARLVWATEIAKWTGQEALLLNGRGADEARWYCLPCRGTGRVAGEKCESCKTKNGSSYGNRRAADVPRAVEQEARWVIVNYDLLVPQTAHDAAGRKLKDETLPGWSELLAGVEWSVVIADEAHMLRGRGDMKRRGDSRRERLVAASTKAERFWALTGTPLVGRVADLWGLLDTVTNGLFGRPFFNFDVTYADGHRGQYGWVADGATNVEELKSRLAVLMWKRTRAQLNQFMPPKTRQVVTLELPTEGMPRKSPGDPSKGVAAALRRTAKIKAPAVVEAVVDEMAEGAKVIVFAYLKRNAEDLAKSFAAATMKPPLKGKGCKVWAVSGETPTDVRFRNAEAFREHNGPAVFVATLDSVQVAISLKGAQSVHFADLHYEPAALLQAEDRPYEPGTRGVTVLYYVVAGSIDQHVVDLVLPKMQTLESVGNDAQAGEFAGVFSSEDPADLAEQIWSRHSEAGEVVEDFDD